MDFDSKPNEAPEQDELAALDDLKKAKSRDALKVIEELQDAKMLEKELEDY